MPSVKKGVCSVCWARLHGQHVCFDPSGKQGHQCRNTPDHAIIVPDECPIKVHVLMDGKSECKCGSHNEWKKQAQKI